MADNDDTTSVHFQDGKPYSMSKEGVEEGLGARTFYYKSRQTGKMVGPFMGLGKRNMEFRRAEAEKAGFDFHECPGGTCKHPEARG